MLHPHRSWYSYLITVYLSLCLFEQRPLLLLGLLPRCLLERHPAATQITRALHKALPATWIVYGGVFPTYSLAGDLSPGAPD